MKTSETIVTDFGLDMYIIAFFIDGEKLHKVLSSSFSFIQLLQLNVFQLFQLQWERGIQRKKLLY